MLARTPAKSPRKTISNNVTVASRIRELATSIQSGQFDARADESGIAPEERDAIAAVNQIVNAFAGPLRITARLRWAP